MAESETPTGEDRANGARPIPRISIQAFCERPETADAMQVVAEDRRFSKAHFTTHMGGINAAYAHYQESPTPNLILLESLEGRDQLIVDLDRLAEVCDAGTKVLVIGHQNDVLLYREIIRRGVSEYLVAPCRTQRGDGGDLQPLQRSGVRSRRPRHLLHRRQGRRRRQHRVPQHGLGAVGDPQGRRRHRRPGPAIRHGRPGLQSGSDPGHRRGAVEPGASRRGAAGPAADEVLAAPEPVRRAGRARSRLRHLAGCLRDGARCGAPERALRRRRPAAYLGAVDEAAR